MFNVINEETNKPVNIVHFQGRTFDGFPKTIKIIQDYAQLKNKYERLSIVSCWTDDSKCILKQQLDKFNIQLINALPNNYDFNSKWYMPNKIKYYIDCLENKINTKYVLILDGYDVLICTFDNLIHKFLKTKYRILFNATINNYPDEEIDILYNRNKYLPYAYFNAGCCIGYRDDLIKFYKEALEYINIKNIYNSEQKILRHAFAKYSNNPDQNFIGLDYKREIFLTMEYSISRFTYNLLTKKYNLYINFNKYEKLFNKMPNLWQRI